MNTQPVLQNNMSQGFLLVWMMILTTIQWIILDMYLPALPVIQEEFGVSESYLNWTLNMALIAAAVGTFAGGTLSDRYGRKNLFIAGLVGSAAGSLASAFAGGVPVLIVTRAVTMLCSGIVTSITAAIVKDSFAGEEFRRATAALQAIAATGPIIAPTLGSLIINVGGWRYIFILMAVLIAITIVPAFRMTETWPLEQRSADSFRAVVRDSASFLKNKGFLLFIGIYSAVMLPLWSYIGVSSYIFITEFGVKNTTYSLYYAVCAFMSLLGPFVYMTLEKRVHVRKIVHLELILLGIAAATILAFGLRGPSLYVLCVIPLMVSEGITRPLSMVVLLEENPRTAGTASSWLQFIGNVVGAIGTTVATLSWTSLGMGIGVITAACFAFGGLCWIVLLKGRMMKAFTE